MKKIIALALAMLLVLSCAAFAEEAAAYTYTEYNYDETLFEGIGGDWIAMDSLGLMFYLPDVYTAAEVSEEMAEKGFVGIFGADDGVGVYTVAYGPAVDVDGNPIATVEDLAAYYTAVGATNVDVIIVNGIPVVTSLMEANDNLSYSVFFEDSTQCILSFGPASDANTTLLAGLMVTSLMVAEVEE